MVRASQLLLALILALLPTLATSAPLDWVFKGSQFYTQTGAEGHGFLVSNADGIPFLTELQSRGGPEALGYPISGRFIWRGTVVQAFQKSVLQWNAAEKRIAYLNVFDDLAFAGKNEWLRKARSTPDQTWLENESKLSWDDVVKGRLALLDANPAIRARYFSVRDPMTIFGLPSSRVEDMGNHFALRTQRAVIQQWKIDVPWAKAGETTVANGGDIAKEAGLFPSTFLNPLTPDDAFASITPSELAGSPPSTPAPPMPSPAATPPPPSPFKQPPMAELLPAGAARRVAIDPGHGGGQIGAAGMSGETRLLEKDMALDVAKRTAEMLRGAGYAVVLTRETDAQAGGPNLSDDLQARIDIANNFKADVYVSMHFNGLSNPAARGIEVYYAADRPFSDSSRALADLLFQQIGRHMNAAGYDPVARGVKRDTVATGGDHFFVLSPQTRRVKRPGQMPGALVEPLFMSNSDDVAQVKRPEMRQAIARGYAVAIAAFLNGRRA